VNTRVPEGVAREALRAAALRLIPHSILDAMKRRQEQLSIHYRHRRSVEALAVAAKAISAHCLEGIRTIEEWNTQRPALKRQICYMLGIEPLHERTPLCATVTGTMEREGYRIEKLVYQSKPSLFVTGNFYLPTGAGGGLPCVVYLCGHMPHPSGAKTQCQDRYLWYPRHGFACLVLDPLEFGEVPGIHHGASDLNMWHWLSLGYTPAGVEVWNAMRALDWLGTRPEVDPQRIGVTGISGGGVMTWFLAALDDRVRVAIPSCSTYTIGTQVAGRLVPRQCDCTFYPNVFRQDFPVVAALIAPRPLLITSGRRDGIFPPAGYQEVFRRAKKIYDLHEKSGTGSTRIREVDDNCGHTDSPRLLGESRRWMQRWLSDPQYATSDRETAGPSACEPPENLKCLTAIPRDAANFYIHDRFVRTARGEVPDTAADWESRRSAILSELKERVFGWFPREPIPFRARTLRNRGAYVSAFAAFAEREIHTERNVPVRLLEFKPKPPLKSSALLVIVKRARDSVYFPDIDELLPLFDDTSVLVLNPRFTDHPLTPPEFAEVERTAALAGRTTASMQIWDTVRMVRWALAEGQFAESPVCVYGRGEAGIVALYAALMEERIVHVILRDPPSSHWQGPALLSILRHTDIPEITGCLAPRTLTFLTSPPEAFGLTRDLYRRCGAENRIACATSLAAAVRAIPWRPLGVD